MDSEKRLLGPASLWISPLWTTGSREKGKRTEGWAVARSLLIISVHNYIQLSSFILFMPVGKFCCAQNSSHLHSLTALMLRDKCEGPACWMTASAWFDPRWGGVSATDDSAPVTGRVPLISHCLHMLAIKIRHVGTCLAMSPHLLTLPTSVDGALNPRAAKRRRKGRPSKARHSAFTWLH